MINLVEFRKIPLPTEGEVTSTWHGEHYEPIVSIICTAYNQELYIDDAIRGFLMQKTDFPFEIIIHDDASTDSTAEIIKSYANRYPNIIKTILQQENQYSKASNSVFLISAEYSKGEYIALCEGDDFWISEEKLQKQKETMDADPACSMVVHNAYRLNNNSVSTLFKKITVNYDFGPDDILDVYVQFAPTASYFFRRSIVDHLPEWFKFAPVGDLFIELYSYKVGKGIFLHEPYSVYRVQAVNSWSTRVSATRDSRVKIYKKFISSFNNLLQDFPQLERKINLRKAIIYRMLARQVCDKNVSKSFLSANVLDYKGIREEVKVLRCLTPLRFYIYFPSSLVVFNVFHIIEAIQQRGRGGLRYFYRLAKHRLKTLKNYRSEMKYGIH